MYPLNLQMFQPMLGIYQVSITLTKTNMQVGRTVDCQLAAMSGQRLASFGCGDEDSGKLQEQFQSWAQDILEAQTQQADASAAVDTLEPVIEQVTF